MQYRFTGSGPDVSPDGQLVHPGDVREHPEEPAWGRWELAEAEGSEKPSEALEPATPTQPDADEAENAPTGQPEPSSTKEA